MHRPTSLTGPAEFKGKAPKHNDRLAGFFAAGFMAGAALLSPLAAQAQDSKLAAAPPVTYANRYELYAGFNFQNTQAGQAIPYRANLGGIELLGTDWLTKKFGVGIEFRGEAGSTPTNPAPIAQYLIPSRPNILETMYFGGVEYRGPKNQHAALNFHAFGGAAHGYFDIQTAGSNPPVNVGLYTDRTRPQFALGTSVDFNASKNWAVRFAPDLILEHWGTETREFFYISGGIVHRFGKK